jgi:hypothetical protein
MRSVQRKKQRQIAVKPHTHTHTHMVSDFRVKNAAKE